MSNPKAQNLRVIVRSTYDLQQLRISMGNRLVANFKAKIGQAPSMPEDGLSDEAKALLATLRGNTKKISDGVVPLLDEAAGVTEDEEVGGKIGRQVLDLIGQRYNAITEKRKNFPPPSAFVADAVISNYTELCLISQYIEIERNEKTSFTRLGHVIKDYPIYTEFLDHVPGIGPAMGGVLISEIDIDETHYVSGLWALCGLDVVQVNGQWEGRSRRAEHLVDREYTTKEGKLATKKSITFNPMLKTKLLGVLAGSFLKARNSYYSQFYYNYKHRMESHPLYGIQAFESATTEEQKHKASKSHRHLMANRYMIKRFLADFYVEWRTLEGLPVRKEFHEEKLGHVHARFPKEWAAQQKAKAQAAT